MLTVAKSARQFDGGGQLKSAAHVQVSKVGQG
jgi:hypothetical protein